MGLFSNIKVDKSAASLFTQPVKQVDLIKVQTEVPPTNSVAELEAEVESEVESEVDVETEKLSEEEADVDLEDAYVKRSGGIKESDVLEDTGRLVPAIEKSKLETQDKRSAAEDLECTLFVKNVPNAVMGDRKALREFKQLFSPGIQSVRFRSIAMSEGMPRKIAYIKNKLHPARDAVNSYIVYKDPTQVHEALSKLNRTLFMDHHLLVDSASRPRAQVPKRSVFIGNLSFEASEEDLYRKFEECGTIENLRVVRDRKVNLGKGFAYVQFEDVSSVQVALLQDGKELDGRTLRVVRCSSEPSGGDGHKKKERHNKAYKQKQTDRSRKGDPNKKEKEAKKKALESQVRAGMVLEGERSKAGNTIPLGRKRKARSATGRNGGAKKVRK